MRNRRIVLRFLSAVAVAGVLVRLVARQFGAKPPAHSRGTRDASTAMVGSDPATWQPTVGSAPGMPVIPERQHIANKPEIAARPAGGQSAIPPSQDLAPDSSPSPQDDLDGTDVAQRNPTSSPADNSAIIEPPMPSPISPTTKAALLSSESGAEAPSAATHQQQRSRDSTGRRAQTPAIVQAGSYEYTRRLDFGGFARRQILKHDDPFELGLVCRSCHIELPKSGRCDYCE